MTDDQSRDFLTNIKKFWHPINLYNKLKSLYFKIFPKGSRAYSLTYGFLRVFLKKLHIFNIYYQEWIRRFDTLDAESLQIIQNQIKAMGSPVVISVIMPVFNPPLHFLDLAIQSVINQAYPHWELCIADDASTNPQVTALIQNYTQKDSRIKAVFRKENGHISAASNSALELATHDYCALLDHDDELHPLALFYVAQTIQKHPDSVIIYSDEDKITKSGRRLDPYFKPDFDYELLLSQNFISHLGVYKTSVLHEVGGFRIGLEGSQDYDLLLRVLEQCNSNQIQHIPRPLYHWRIIKESAAEDLNVKPYAIKAAVRAISEHYSRRNIEANVTFMPETASYQSELVLPEKVPSVELIIFAQLSSVLLEKNIKSIERNTAYLKLKITICLPGAELDELHAPLSKNNHFKTVNIHECGSRSKFAQAANQIVEASTADFIIFMKDGISGFTPGCLSKLVSEAVQPGIGAVGPKLMLPSGNIYSNGLILNKEFSYTDLYQGEYKTEPGYFGWAKIRRGYSALSENFLLVKRENFLKVGGFNENLHLWENCGMDFCLKLKEAKLRNVLVPSIHLFIEERENNVIKPDDFDLKNNADKIYLQKRWEDWFLKDPGFNPNLTITDKGKILVKLSPDLNFPGV